MRFPALHPITWSAWRTVVPRRPKGAQPLRSPRRACVPCLERLEDRTLPATTLTPDTAAFLEPGTLSGVDAIATPGEVDVYPIGLSQSGRLTAQVHAEGFRTRLSLLNGDGSVLIQSDGFSPANADDVIVQHLEGTSTQTGYFLKVEGLGGGTGTYILTTEFVPATAPFEPLPVGDSPQAVIAADINGDGRVDVVTANGGSNDLSLLLGQGDGTFAAERRLPVGSKPIAVVAADFNGDGRLDLAAANYESDVFSGGSGSNDLSVLLAKKDGSFSQEQRISVGTGFISLLAGDVNNDGRLDLVATNGSSNDLSLLLGQGDGSFAPELRLAVGATPDSVAAGDVNGDGWLDLVTANSGSNDLSLLLGQGDGRFAPEQRLAVGSVPLAVAAADVNGDARIDLVTANSGSGDVSLYLGLGNGSFAPERRLAVGFAPASLVLADVNADGQLELITANSESNDVSVRLGLGDGAFASEHRFAVGSAPRSVAAADVDGDGRLDLVAAKDSGNVSMLLGSGDGSFAAERRLVIGNSAVSLVAADLNGDGRLDLAATGGPGQLSSKPGSPDLSVLIGEGDGSFTPESSLVVGNDPRAITAADLNDDGRLDLIIANYFGGGLSVLLGNGDGRFAAGRNIDLKSFVVSIAAVDVNGDGRLDLVTADQMGSDVLVLLGLGDGSFAPERRFSVGPPAQSLGAVATFPEALVAADINDDGRLDLVTVSPSFIQGSPGVVSLLLGQGDGRFAPEQRLAVGSVPLAVAAADVNGDARLDLVTVNSGPDVESPNIVSVLLGRGDGSFTPERQFAVGYSGLLAGTSSQSLAVADVNGDGHLDLVTANSTSDDLSLLLGQGDGSFAAEIRLAVGHGPTSVVVADANGDGRLDLIAANSRSSDLSLLLGNGDGTFRTFVGTPQPFRVQPVLADANGDGDPDAVALGREGQITLRLGRNGSPGVFEAPVLLNPPPVTPPARDIALVSANPGFVLAALDTTGSGVSVYSRDPVTGIVQRLARFDVPDSQPVRLVAGDLNGDGLNDLVIAATGDGNRVFVYFQTADGTFAQTPDATLPVGPIPSDITLADVNADGLPDLVVTNQSSGDVSILLNQGDGHFASDLRFRAGTGLYGIESTNNSFQVTSRDGSLAVVAGLFDADAFPDLVVLNADSNTFTLLRGDGSGGFLNPQTHFTGSKPIAVVAGDFNGNNALDLAILNEGSGDISLFLGDGQGDFTEKFITISAQARTRLSAGLNPAGLALTDVDGDGILDLVVNSENGDLLTLKGNGDGTFQPYQRASRNVSLAAADLDGDNITDTIVANQKSDTVSIHYSRSQQDVTLRATDGIQAPSAATVADLNGDGLPDLVFANSGANNIVVYLGTGTGQFDLTQKFTFDTGTTPAGITIADLNDDLVPDPNDLTRLIDPTPDVVVANEGSNDLTLFLGQGTGASWTLQRGLRLRVGNAPVATVVHDFDGDGRPDLLVSNSQSNTLTLLPGLGNGFFPDQTAATLSSGQVFELAVGGNPVSVLLGNFDGTGTPDLITVDSATNDLTYFPNFRIGDRNGIRISSEGINPVAAVATDFNLDGIADLAVLNTGDGSLAYFLGGPSGLTFQSITRDPALKDAPSITLSPLGIVVVDVNGATTTLASAIVASLGSAAGSSSLLGTSLVATVVAQAVADFALLALGSGNPLTAAVLGPLEAVSSGSSQAQGAAAVPSSGIGNEAILGGAAEVLPSGLVSGEDRGLFTDSGTLSGLDIAGSLLFGAKPVAQLLPQKGPDLAPVATLVTRDPGEERTSPAEQASDEEPPFTQRMVGLDYESHRLRALMLHKLLNWYGPSFDWSTAIVALDQVFLPGQPLARSLSAGEQGSGDPARLEPEQAGSSVTGSLVAALLFAAGLCQVLFLERRGMAPEDLHKL